MWLYTLAEWTCTRNANLKTDFEDVKERLVSRYFVGDNVNSGLDLLKEYTDRFNARPVNGPRRFVVEYRLIALTKLPDDVVGAFLQNLECLEISRTTIELALRE